MSLTISLTGLDDLVINERVEGSPLITIDGVGNLQVTGRTQQNYPVTTSSPNKAKNLLVSTVLTQAKLDLLELYHDEQELNGEDGNLIFTNTEFSITAAQLAIGNREQVGATITTTGINKYHYRFRGLLILPPDYFSPLSIGSNSLGARYPVTFQVEELWN
jgi:hypothetical protein